MDLLYEGYSNSVALEEAKIWEQSGIYDGEIIYIRLKGVRIDTRYELRLTDACVGAPGWDNHLHSQIEEEDEPEVEYRASRSFRLY